MRTVRGVRVKEDEDFWEGRKGRKPDVLVHVRKRMKKPCKERSLELIETIGGVEQPIFREFQRP